MSKWRAIVSYRPYTLPINLLMAGQIFGQAADRSVEDLARRVERRAKLIVSVDRGQLKGSIATAFVAPRHRKVGSGLHYAPHVEYGTKPHWPPRAPIREWVWRNRRKFGVTGGGKTAQAEVDRITFLVQRAIARRGTKGRKYLRRALAETMPEARKVIGYYTRQAVARLVR